MPVASSIPEYLSEFDGERLKRMQQIHEILEKTMPSAEQRISYGMPTFKLGKSNAFHYAAFSNHVSIFPSVQAIEHFADKLKPYKTSKGTIQFQNNEPLPLDLITEIAIWRKHFLETMDKKQ